DAGHFQVEMDFGNLTYDRSRTARSAVTTLAFEAAPMNLKIGICNDLDLQLTLAPYRWKRTDAAGKEERKSGFGDMAARMKFNVLGNDRGPFALALLPFVKLPTNQDQLGNRSVEGGLKVPYSLEVTGWDLSAQT